MVILPIFLVVSLDSFLCIVPKCVIGNDIRKFHYSIMVFTYFSDEAVHRVIFVLLVIHRHVINTLRPRQNGRLLADDTFKCIFLNENVWGLAEIPLKYVPECRIDDKQALVQIMAWCRSGDKPLSKPMMVILLTHICVTRPQCVNWKCKQNPRTFLGSFTSYEYICM